MTYFHPRTSTLTILAIVVLLGSCSKFEEGPKFSLRTKKSRIVEHWVAEYAKVTVDGELITELEGNYAAAEYFLLVKKEGTYNAEWGPDFHEGSWELTGETTLKFVTTSNDIHRYDILRLAKDELWLYQEDTYAGSTTIVELKYKPQ